MNKREYEDILVKRGCHLIGGCDEAGRGPLAGPVVVACVVLPLDFYDDRIDDSKRLTPAQRQLLYQVIVEAAIDYQIIVLPPLVIDQINILEATKLAAKEAVKSLKVKIDGLLLDALKLDIIDNEISIIKGDQKSISIASASILAKVTRDKIMENYQEQYPDYNFAKHKGYPTKQHYEEIEKNGLTPIHRLSFCKKNKKERVKT